MLPFDTSQLRINWGIAASLGTLGWLALRRGDLKQAVSLLVESLTLRREIIAILAEILGESFLTSTWDTRLLLPSEHEVLLDDP